MALLVVAQPNPVGAAIALVTSFFGVAVLYVLLHAHFVAVMQLLLYAGAIMVFFVFVIMLLNLQPKKLAWQQISGGRLLAGSAALYLLTLLVLSIVTVEYATPSVGEEVVPGTIEAVGTLLFSKYFIPFEITSVLLFVAIVGAVMMGKKKLS